MNKLSAKLLVIQGFLVFKLHIAVVVGLWEDGCFIAVGLLAPAQLFITFGKWQWRRFAVRLSGSPVSSSKTWGGIERRKPNCECQVDPSLMRLSRVAQVANVSAAGWIVAPKDITTHKLWPWSYLEKGSLHIELSYISWNELLLVLRWVVSPVAGVLIRRGKTKG
jgi:hypothetical protein